MGSTPLRFVFIADCQFGAYATFSGMDAEDVARFAENDMTVRAVPATTGFEWEARQYERAIATVNDVTPDFVVVGGDMVDDPRDEGQLAALRRITALLRPGIDVHWVPGNHDVAFDAAVPTPESVDQYRRRFGADAYAFHRDEVSFIVGNSTIWARPEELPGGWAGQLGFLETELEAARRRGSAHIVVFAHHPLFTRSVNEEDSYWNIARERRSILLDLFSDYSVSTVFSGHWHRNGGGTVGDLELVISGPVGYPLASDPPGLRVVEVDSKLVEHRYVALPAFDSEPGG